MRNRIFLTIYFLLNCFYYAYAKDDFSKFSSTISKAASNSIDWGVNIRLGDNNPQNVANVLSDRNLKSVRLNFWGSDPASLTQFIATAEIMNEKNIKVQAIVFSVFSGGQSRNGDYSANLAEVEQTVYNNTKPQIESVKNLVSEFELQNEIPLYPNMAVSGATGQNALDYDTPAGRLQAAVLRGMSRAIDDVRKASNLSFRIILGTVDRRFGFLSYMLQQGVIFDITGYHTYPWENQKPLDTDPWFGTGGALGQLALFDKPIHINEFNSGEIYQGASGHPGIDYENLAGKDVTEAGFRSLYKHLTEIVNHTVANVEAVYFYGINDQTNKAKPENRFGLYYDAGLQKPKISLLIATAFAGGSLSLNEKDSLLKRNFTYYNITTDLSSEIFDNQLSIKVYPNPAKDFIEIQTGVGFSSIRIYNSFGIIVFTQQTSGLNNLHLDVSSFPLGIYFVEVEAEHKTVVGKIVKI